MDTANLFSKKFPVLFNDIDRLPITNGIYFTELMPEDFQQGAFYLQFFDTLGDVVTPSAGTITVQISPIEGQWHLLDRHGTIAASSVGAISTYTVPVFCALARQGRVQFDGIAGADHCRAFFWRGITA